MRRRRNNNNGAGLALLILAPIGILVFLMIKYWKITLIVLSVIIGLTLIITIPIIITKKKKDKYKHDIDRKVNEFKEQPNYNKPVEVKQQPKPKLYEVKQKYVSNCEQEYFIALKNIIGDKFIIYPQVPLSQIIEKNTNGFANELFRVVDFCIFNFQMKPLVCIEINDSTHNQYHRIQRDRKVHEILSAAGLPLITLWTNYGVKPDYIRKRLQDYINV